MTSKRMIVFSTFVLLGCAGGEIDDSVNPACGRDSAPLDLRRISMDVNGMTRTFVMSAPAVPAGTKLPVIVGFHGGSGANVPFVQEAEFEALAEEQGVITVYPKAVLVAPNEGEWVLNTGANAQHDIDFVDSILDTLTENYCVDETRIFSTGYSLGSMFNYEVACQLNHRFAATASFAGTMPISPESCDIEDPMSILHLHSVDDEIIPYDSDWNWKNWDSVGQMHSIPGLIEAWRDRYSCTEVQETQGESTQYVAHTGCVGDATVAHYRFDNQGHWWPERIEGTPTPQILWDFFSEHPK